MIACRSKNLDNEMYIGTEICALKYTCFYMFWNLDRKCEKIYKAILTIL